MRFFLWIAILGWAVGFAAKLFDLVVAGAWTASPPASFTLLPYGSRYPVNPGDFFIPLSALIALGSLGALVSGWKSPARPWLWLGVTVFLLIWVLTPTVFWPMLQQLFDTARGRVPTTEAESVRLAHRWLWWDWLRMGLIAVGFLASVRAFSLPAARREV